MDKFCVWFQDDEDSESWGTDCGNDFILNDGSPLENRMKFCCYCGRPLKEQKWEAEATDAESAMNAFPPKEGE